MVTEEKSSDVGVFYWRNFTVQVIYSFTKSTILPHSWLFAWEHFRSFKLFWSLNSQHPNGIRNIAGHCQLYIYQVAHRVKLKFTAFSGKHNWHTHERHQTHACVLVTTTTIANFVFVRMCHIFQQPVSRIPLPTTDHVPNTPLTWLMLMRLVCRSRTHAHTQ